MPERPTYPPPPPPVEQDEGRVHEPERERYSERPGFPELLKRGLEAGRGRFERNLGESFFPKDVASQLVASIGDLRQGVVSAVAHEVGLFLREADIASEVRQLLTGLEVEAKVHLSFKEADDGSLETDVKMDNPRGRRRRARARASKKSDPPPAPGRTETSDDAPVPSSKPPDSDDGRD